METQVANYRIIIFALLKARGYILRQQGSLNLEETPALMLEKFIEPETRPNGEKVFKALDQRSQDTLVAYCPTLQVTDYGDSVEEVLASIQHGIQLAIESLIDEGKEVPQDNIAEQVITSTEVKIPLKV